jgi:hypothetical protein
MAVSTACLSPPGVSAAQESSATVVTRHVRQLKSGIKAGIENLAPRHTCGKGKGSATNLEGQEGCRGIQ